ncbi:tyrosine-type recombinase/integrase [Micromonospora chersina]|uniref:tyrosine-type recombinase/integrase n=1 Tax=Micromonospora chersina TaxID=47854 RepID=UPI0037188E7B
MLKSCGDPSSSTGLEVNEVLDSRRRAWPRSDSTSSCKRRSGRPWATHGKTSAWSSPPASVHRSSPHPQQALRPAPGPCGLRRVRFHDLRHSCATLLYEQGVPIEKIQDVLGQLPDHHEADLR